MEETRIASKIIETKYYENVVDILKRSPIKDKNNAKALTHRVSIGNTLLHVIIKGYHDTYTMHEIYISIEGRCYRIMKDNDTKGYSIYSKDNDPNSLYEPMDKRNVKVLCDGGIFIIEIPNNNEKLIYTLYYEDEKDWNLLEFEIRTKYE